MWDAGEDAASAVIRAHPGVPVRRHDDQSKPGMHDLEIAYPDGRRGAVEVTAAEDQRLAAGWGALAKQPVLRDERLSRGWLVVLLPNASVNTARALLPDLLVEVWTVPAFVDEI